MSSMKKNRPTPWFDQYENINPNKKVIILGGGISGASTAFALAKRGFKVSLYEKNFAVATGASGNKQAILYGSFSGNYTPNLELSINGYQYSQNLIRSLLEENIDYQSCGIIQLAHNESEKNKQQQMLCDAQNFPPNLFYQVKQEEIAAIAGLKIDCATGLYFPSGIWLQPRQLVNKLCQDKQIQLFTGHNIHEIEYLNNSWQIKDLSGKIIAGAPNLVLCNAFDINQFQLTQNIPLRKIRGQISIIEKNLGLKTVICGNGYITPNCGNSFTLGATFKFNHDNLNISNKEHRENLSNLSKFIPSLQQNFAHISGQANFRGTTYDYMPLVGPLAEFHSFTNTYRNLAQDKNYWLETKCPYLPGLFINALHGAKGMLTAPICGEIIADYISNKFSNCSEFVRQALHPNRFWLKQIIKHQI